MEKFKSMQQYLKAMNSNTYSHLTECIQSESAWENNHVRTNPAMFELFTTHEHLRAVREQLFKYAGIRLNKGDLVELENRIEQHWKKSLPSLFPGYDFAILKDTFSNQIAFCRVRKGITDNPTEIKKFMADADSNIRWNALLSATLYPDPALVPHLYESLTDENTCNVIQALAALGNCGDEKSAQLLGERFLPLQERSMENSPIDDFIAYDLFEAMIKSGRKGFQLLLQLLTNYAYLDPRLLEYLCEVMGKTEDIEVLNLLVKIYFDYPEGSEGALTGLLNMEEVAFAKILPFTEHIEADYRQKAMWLLANCCMKDAHPLLKAGLKDKNAVVREAAVYGIGRFSAHDRKTILLKASHDESVRVRVRSLKALGNLHDKRLLSLFQYHCYDRSPAIRFEAMCAIAELESAESLRFLSNLFSESSTRDKLRIIYSLYGFSGKKSLLNSFIKKARCDEHKLIKRELGTLIEGLGLS